MKDFTDREIVDAILTRELLAVNQATTQLYRQHHKMITQMVCTHGGTKVDAEDLFQDLIVAFLDNVWSAKFQLGEGTKVGTYLYKVAQNLWFKKVRGRKSTFDREQKYSKDFDDSAPDDPNALDQMIAVDEEKVSLSIFRKLSDDAQELLRAFYFKKLSFKEIAVTLGYPSDNAAKMQKSRFMRELSNIMKQSKAL